MAMAMTTNKATTTTTIIVVLSLSGSVPWVILLSPEKTVLKMKQVKLATSIRASLIDR